MFIYEMTLTMWRDNPYMTTLFLFGIFCGVLAVIGEMVIGLRLVRGISKFCIGKNYHRKMVSTDRLEKRMRSHLPDIVVVCLFMTYLIIVFIQTRSRKKKPKPEPFQETVNLAGRVLAEMHFKYATPEEIVQQTVIAERDGYTYAYMLTIGQVASISDEDKQKLKNEI